MAKDHTSSHTIRFYYVVRYYYAPHTQTSTERATQTTMMSSAGLLALLAAFNLMQAKNLLIETEDNSEPDDGWAISVLRKTAQYFLFFPSHFVLTKFIFRDGNDYRTFPNHRYIREPKEAPAHISIIISSMIHHIIIKFPTK